MSEERDDAGASRSGDVGDIRDLSDFCVRWDDLKGHVTDEALEAAALTPESKEVVRWLRKLAEKTMTTM